MANMREVKINGYSVFFEELEQLQKPDRRHDSQAVETILNWSDDVLGKAAQPLLDVLSGLRQATQAMAPDEMELSMQLELAVNGETPVFKVLSLGSKCQIAAKFVWKK